MSHEESKATRRQSLAAVGGVAGAAAGLYFAPSAYAFGSGDDDVVAVVPLEAIIFDQTAEPVEQELREIRQNDEVEAVVIQVNSGGGGPAASERLYKAVQRTNEEMPVVAAVDTMGLSGGYYAMLPAEEIFVKPTTEIGSVGVNTIAPQTQQPIRGPTGPDKATNHPTEFWSIVQTLDNVFVETVMENRGDRLELSREEVAHAGIYLGVEAVQNGIADEIGSLDTAIEAAAQMAGLDDYEIDVRNTGIDDDGIILLQTDESFVALEDGTPDYGDVEFHDVLMADASTIPHVDDVERFAGADLEREEAADDDGGEEE